MFKPGDAVIHPTSGAGFVIGRASMPMKLKHREFYKIEILGKTKTTILVPVDNAEILGLRPAISGIELDQVWQILSASPDKLPDDHKERYKALEKKLETKEISMIAEVVRDLEWRRSQIDRLNTPGQRIYNRAMRLLAGEIAVAQGVEMQSAQAHIETVLDKNLASYQV